MLLTAALPPDLLAALLGLARAHDVDAAVVAPGRVLIDGGALLPFATLATLDERVTLAEPVGEA